MKKSATTTVRCRIIQLPYGESMNLSVVIFGVSAALGVVGLVWSLLLPESVHSTPEDRARHRLLDLSNVRESVRTVLRPRPGPGRVAVWLLVLNFAVFMFPLNTGRFDYLLVQLKYDWTIVQYSTYLSVQRVCRLLGLFLLLPFVSRVLKVDDSLTASVCTLGTIAAYFLMAVGQEEWRGPNGTWQVSSFCCVRICTLSTTKDLIPRFHRSAGSCT